MAWAPDYTTASAMKTYLRIPSGDTVDDTLIARCVTAASRGIDHETRRQFGSTAAAESRTYDVPVSRRLYQVVDIDDVYSILDFGVTNGGVDITDSCRLQPVNALSKGSVYTELRVPGDLMHGEVVVTARYGWAAVPPTIVAATEILASRYYTRRDAPFGIIGGPELGNQFYVSRTDPDVSAMVRQFYRWWG